MRKIIFRVIIPIGIVISAFLFPLFKIAEDIYWPMTISSLVFAILVGFFIATATTNFINFQSFLAQEAANIVALFNLFKIIKPSAEKEMADKIDRYAIATLGFTLTEYTDKTRVEFDDIIKTVDEIDAENAAGANLVALDHLYATKIGLLKNKASIVLVALRLAKGLHWLVLSLLAGVLVLLLFSLRADTYLLNLVIGVLSSTVYFILLLFYEIDGNIFLEEQVACRDIQIIFKGVGKLPFYPSFALKWLKREDLPVRYRVGHYLDYPHSAAVKIKIINSKANNH